MQQKNHTRQELEVEWKGIDRITEHPELGGVNKHHHALACSVPWNNLGNNLIPFGLKH